MDVIEQPRLISSPHALLADGRDLCFAEFLPRETLGAYLERNEITIARGPVLVHHNGQLVPEALWLRLIPRSGDLVTIRARMHGSGGSSKVLRSVALIALAAVSYGVASGAIGAGAIASASTATGISAGTLGAAAAATITIGGSLIVSALLPPPKASTPRITAQEADAPSYAIGAASNRSRPFEPMMVVFGRHRVYPDLAGNPHTFYQGDDQFLNQAFHFGVQEEIDITDLRIGDTPIVNYQGVEIQRSAHDGQLTLVPDNVDTLQGFDLLFADGWNARITPADTYHVQVELVGQVYKVNAQTGAFESNAVEVQVEYRSYPEGNWVPIGGYTDPVYATHYWALGVYSNANDDQNNRYWTQIRYGSLNAADHVNGEQYQECFTSGGGDVGETQYCTTYEWRWLPHPYQLGRPWSGVAPDPLIGYTTTSNTRLTGSSSKPVRLTVSFNTGHGQYEVRVRKMNADVATNLESNVVSVSQIRAYQDTPTDYTGQTRLGVRVRATAQLNGSIAQLNGMVEAKCNTFDGTTWTIKHTRNPAWWFLRFAVGERDEAGNRVWGAGMLYSQVDLDAIYAWAAWCDARGLTFDYVLTQQRTAHDMLTMIARAGRGSYTWQTGKLGVIWDAANQPYVGMIGPYNIKAGTFEVSYADATVDEIVGTFINPARNWEADEVRVRVPGAPLLNSPLKLDLEGNTDAALAGREVNLIAASQLFHRRRVVWEMDIEGMMCTRGDVVQISHDLTVWGYAGRLLGGSRFALRLDRSVPVAATFGWMTLRSPLGHFITFQVSGPGGAVAGEYDTLYPIAPIQADFPVPDEVNEDGIVALDWAWQFDPLATPGRRLKIVHAQPTNDEGVRFEAVDDDPNYYASEWNPFLYTPPRDGALIGGIVFALSFSETINGVSNDDIAVRLDYVLSSAGRVLVEYRINGEGYTAVETTERSFTIPAHSGDFILVTVTPITLTGKGTSKDGSYTVTGLLAPVPTVTGLTSVYRDGLTVLKWDAVKDVRPILYEVRTGVSWGNSQTVALTPNLEMLPTANGRFFVAARYETPKGTLIYGVPDSLEVAGATLVRNVLVTKYEHPTWTGDLGGAEDVPVVATEPTRFGGGDDSRTVFNLPLTTVDGEPVIYRDDWQGRQLLYRTPRTNQLLRSQSLDLTPWGPNPGYAAVATSIRGPDGVNNFWKLVRQAGGGLTQGGRTQTVTKPSAAVMRYTGFFDAKAAEYNRARLYLNGANTSTAIAYITVNLLTGAIVEQVTGSAFSNVVGGALLLPDGSYRVWLTVDTDTHGNIAFRAYSLDSAATVGDGSSGIYYTNTFLGPGELASYVPTVASAVTITDYSRSGATITTAVAPQAGASMLWTGSGSRTQGGAFVIDNKLTLRGIGDLLAADDILAMDDVLWYGGVSGRGTYETNDANVIDIGYPAPVRIDFDIDAYALNFGENVLAMEDLFAEEDVLNSSNMQFYSVTPQIRSATAPGQWTEWADFVPGLINGRFFDVRLALETRNPLIVPFVESFTWTVDVPDLIQRGEIVTLPSAGARITYPKPFHATPNVQITWLDAVAGDRYVLTNQDATGFDLRFFNNATPVSRQFNYISQGY
ncbi:host specificity factor TipJ family phage tail protein [Schauerella aestuarii]|uniref:host specificity factor TipJ family phage tail protein n=1 Tax=Schauerella aestuarii TaxID=2511204 RepID=UPI0013688E21|nr:host specificity factor TipJ family phage tail protein [Achromobacter aestuarii]MYZ41431.1 hypothetical protein [Achromobacter aestuarii]